MCYKTLLLVCFISVWTFSQNIVEEIDTTKKAVPEDKEIAEETDTVKTSAPIQESTEETDTAGTYSPVIQETVGETETKETYTPVQQKKVNLLETIPEPPTKPIAQTVVGAILTGSGCLVLILDFVLIGLENATYGEIRPSDKPMIIIYAVAGGAELISGIALLSVATPKWKEYNEWEAKYKHRSMNTLKIKFTFNF